MIKKISCLAVMIITAFFVFFMIIQTREKTNNSNRFSSEVRGVFISYIEYMKYFQNKDAATIQQEIDRMIHTAKDLHFNCIYFQVRAFSDSVYESDIFPFSHTITGIQGKKLNFDILEYVIKVAHQNQMDVHAWVNPYRISNDTDIAFLSKDNPAYQWLSTNHVQVIENKGIFYNPASEEVKKLVIEGVKEIVSNYDVDGILLDDYFYPDSTIDLENYQEVENTISLTDFRLSKINELISGLYEAIKSINPNVLFGVSPDGNIENNYSMHYADVKKWLKEEGYVDYIMPQIYYGFLHETMPFIQTVNEWKELIQNHTKLVIALSIYKSGTTDRYAGSGMDEWIHDDDIIAKQIKVIRNLPSYTGFSIFRYAFFLDAENNIYLQNEIQNYLKLFN